MALAGIFATISCRASASLSSRQKDFRVDPCAGSCFLKMSTAGRFLHLLLS